MSVLLSTAFLPPISYICRCLHSDQVIIERFENYIKQTCRNHYHIYGPNGLQLLTVPVHKINGNHTLIKDIRIARSIPWQRLQWRSIETAYNNSPFFLFYKDEFIKAFQEQFEFLLDLNTHFLCIIFNILKIDISLGFTEQFLKIPESIEDDRDFMKQKKTTFKDNFPPYTQVFSPKHGFLPDLSIIDLIFNLGPESPDFLISEKNSIFA